MSHKLFFVSVIVVIFAILASNTAALAEPSQQVPYLPQPAIKTPPPPQQPPSNPGASSYPEGSLSSSGDGGEIVAQAIALGKPGTSFRYDKTLGETGVGYFDDTIHLNGVPAVAADSGGSLYTVEENGGRLMKFAGDGTVLWQIGGGGIRYWDQNHLAYPREVTLDLSGNVWVGDNDHLAEYTADGLFIQHFPPEPWNVSDDNNRFSEIRGIAFDNAGRMYITDRYRHRVQVYTFDPDGKPVYLATIGTTDNSSGEDAYHFNEPEQLVVDSAGRLYIADLWNFRVVRCTPTGTASWDCAVFYGGSQGDGVNQLNYAFGLAKDNTGNIYISDGMNGRIFQCDQSAACTVFASGINWPADIAFSPTGSAYISAYGDYTILKVPSAGGPATLFAGTPGVPYLTDTNHFNGPRGLEIDVKGNLYVAEVMGQRLLKYSPTGLFLWSIGVPGIPDENDPANHMSYPFAIGVDRAGGKLAVVGGRNIDFYKASTGTYLYSFDKDWGDDTPYKFKDATGIAFDGLGNFYIADYANQRVTMYNKLGDFIRQYGETNVSGRDNNHFNNPMGVTTDLLNNLYVADYRNCRVQKYSPTGKFLMTFTTQVCGDKLDQMTAPIDVAVDSAYRVYVSEDWNNRVDVYDKTGAYLTTIAGYWGDRTGELRGPNSISADTKGGVYVADFGNNRVQKYRLGVPYAKQKNINGFGKRANEVVSALGTFKGKIYAATTNYSGFGAQILRQAATTTGWEVVVPDGFDNGEFSLIEALREFKGYLYAAGTMGQIWRTLDGFTWEYVTLDGFGNTSIFIWHHLDTYLDNGVLKICARSGNWDNPIGGEIWCSVTGEADTWTPIVENGFGTPANVAIPGWLQVGTSLYAGTTNLDQGAEIWRKVGTGAWQPIMTGGFGDPNFSGVLNLVYFNKRVYASVSHNEGIPEDIEGARIYVCSICDGNDWAQVNIGNLGKANNFGIDAMRIIGTTLYAFTFNRVEGMEIWRTVNGTTWTKLPVPNGFGTSNNQATSWDNSILPVSGGFLVGTNNPNNGGQVWKVCPGLAACY